MFKSFTDSSGIFAGGLFDFESGPGGSDSLKRTWVWQSKFVKGISVGPSRIIGELSDKNLFPEVSMSQAKHGDTVTVHYTGRLENGEVFADSKDGEPLEFTLGSGEVIPGLESGIIGMKAGETKTISVPPEEAYGPRHEELVIDVKKSEFPENLTLAIGQQLQIRQSDGDPLRVTVADIDEDTITLDANHPLADCTLTFTILLVAVK